MPIREHNHHSHYKPHWKGGLFIRMLKSCAITSLVAGAMLWAGIPLTTVLPTSAPILMGFAMLM